MQSSYEREDPAQARKRYEQELKEQMDAKKKLDDEKKRKQREEDEKLEKRMQEQQEKMQREFEEEQNKKKEKERAVSRNMCLVNQKLCLHLSLLISLET